MAIDMKRKVFETAILLTAATDGNFTDTFDKVYEAVRKVKEETENAKKAQNSAGEETQSFAEKAGAAFEAASAAIVDSKMQEALGRVADEYRECVTAAMEFESVMSAVGAISDASSSDMDALWLKAKELGAETVFEARESAQAMMYMAQAGWETRDMLNGMDGVINLSAASGEDLASVSSVVADTLAGFQMEASESERMADVLARTASRTNTGVLAMGESFKSSAALAGVLGYSIEDVSVMLGLMANAGVKGSVAGTTMKNILNGFVGGATLKSSAFGEVEFSAVNPDGSVKSLSETVEELRGYFAQMSSSEKLTNAESIAGMRGYVGLTAILEASDEQYQKLYDDINDCSGAAREMAEIRLDNLEGDVELFKSAVEGLRISIGDELNPNLRDAVQFGSDAINWMNQFVESNPGVVKGVTVLTSTLGAGLGAITAAASVKTLISVLGGLAAFSNPVVLAVGGIAAAIAGVAAGYILLKPEINAVVKETEKLIESHEKLNDEYFETVKSIESQYGDYYDLARQVENLAEKENKSVTEKKLLIDLIDELNGVMPGLNLAYDEQSDSLNKAVGSMDDYIRKMYEMEQAEEEIARAKDLLKQNSEYSEQLLKLDAEIKTQREKVDSSLAVLDNPDIRILEIFKPTVEFAKAQKKLDALESERRLMQAKYAQGVHEYNQAVSAADALYESAESVEAVETTTTNNTESSVVNLTMNGDIIMGEADADGDLLEKLADEIAARFNRHTRLGVMYN